MGKTFRASRDEYDDRKDFRQNQSARKKKQKQIQRFQRSANAKVPFYEEDEED